MSFDFYGECLAKCSSNCKIKIWEEHGSQHVKGKNQSLYLNASYATDSGNPTATDSKEGWRNQARLVDARGSVHDVKLAPRHLGLQLATASEDGFMRMYGEIDDGVTSLSWNKSRFDVLMIVVGGNSNVAKVWGYNNSYRGWQVLSELMGHANAIHDVCWPEGDHLQADVDEVARKHHQDSEVWRVEWNVTRVLASSGDVGTVTICEELGPAMAPPPMDLRSS
ncbi:Nucleoporin [Phytophthora megakarya]|uniref:Nucleoporin n=1 Tax=Phytophthora megakarya TaxID=4795 RepID=A0A225VNT0_9STRA|nr:Nucleoporin [Phytophthora megakarya]